MRGWGTYCQGIDDATPEPQNQKATDGTPQPESPKLRAHVGVLYLAHRRIQHCLTEGCQSKEPWPASTASMRTAIPSWGRSATLWLPMAEGQGQRTR